LQASSIFLEPRMELLPSSKEVFLVYKEKLEQAVQIPAQLPLAPAYVSRQQIAQLCESLNMGVTKRKLYSFRGLFQ
jgi:hypothetical protein